MCKINVVLLAAGKSERFGRDKTLLEVNGETIIERHLRIIKPLEIETCILVVNPTNLQKIKSRLDKKNDLGFKVRYLVQVGEGAEAAIETALKNVDLNLPVYIVNVNDIVQENTYELIEKLSVGVEIIIPTLILSHVFIGGYLKIGDDFSICSIVEKPPGGCKPGTAVNIFVHRLSGMQNLTAILSDINDGMKYEDAINARLKNGASSKVIIIEKWAALKYPQDFLKAVEIFGAAI